ncbi:MAG TPA: hypothetical protein VFE33_06205 [Thermoanaerobaculia bacterium]|nr:hypothetical protein [Thermoanaerobaculia bacterium]
MRWLPASVGRAPTCATSRSLGGSARATSTSSGEPFAENRVVLTHDSDFGRLAITTAEAIVGIVYLRPGHIRFGFTLETLEVLFEELTEVTPPFIAVAERTGDRVRIRYRTL